jgi:hypothetical protein
MRGGRENHRMEITRLCRLYNSPPVAPRPARKASKGKPARRARTARPARKGVFDVGRTKCLEDYIERPGASPNIPGTNVPRLRLIDLGPKAKGAADNEIARVIEGLARHSRDKRTVKHNHNVQQPALPGI